MAKEKSRRKADTYENSLWNQNDEINAPRKDMRITYKLYEEHCKNKGILGENNEFIFGLDNIFGEVTKYCRKLIKDRNTDCDPLHKGLRQSCENLARLLPTSPAKTS